MGREDGYTLIEIVIAAAIGAIVVSLLALLANRFVASAASLDTRLQHETAAQHLFERLTSEAASAWAVYVPHDSDGHEVDFFSEDGAHRTFTWAYTYDAQTKHLYRLGEDLGAFDSFTATNVTASNIGTQDPLFASAAVADVAIGYDSAPEATGGNGLVRIDLQTLGSTRSEYLASANAPTTFTVIVTYTPSPSPTPTSVAPRITMSPGI